MFTFFTIYVILFYMLCWLSQTDWSQTYWQDLELLESVSCWLTIYDIGYWTDRKGNIITVIIGYMPYQTLKSDTIFTVHISIGQI